MKYYIAQNGQPAGPFEVQELLQQGLTINSQVWNETMSGWQPASQVPELAALLTPGAAPQMPPQVPSQQPAQPQYAQPQYQQQAYQQPQYQQAPQQQYQQPQYTYGQPQQQQQPQYGYGQQQNIGAFDSGPSGKSRGVAGLLAIFLGGLGVHYFYVGKGGGGAICILLTLVTCGAWSILTLIQGIMMLTMSSEDFERKYVYSTSTFPLF